MGDLDSLITGSQWAIGQTGCPKTPQECLENRWDSPYRSYSYDVVLVDVWKLSKQKDRGGRLGKIGNARGPNPEIQVWKERVDEKGIGLGYGDCKS